MPTGRPRSRRVLAHSTAGGRRHARHRNQNRPEPSLHPVQSDGHAMSRARYRSEMRRTDDAARRLLSNCRDRFPWAPCLIQVWLRYCFIMTRSCTLKPETFGASAKCARPTFLERRPALPPLPPNRSRYRREALGRDSEACFPQEFSFAELRGPHAKEPFPGLPVELRGPAKEEFRGFPPGGIATAGCKTPCGPRTQPRYTARPRCG